MSVCAHLRQMYLEALITLICALRRSSVMTIKAFIINAPNEQYYKNCFLKRPVRINISLQYLLNTSVKWSPVFTLLIGPLCNICIISLCDGSLWMVVVLEAG